ncbi:hypothetical protein RO3G_01758 [Rhizopus delemar RA 99-880]|uniref:BRCT domain-containing protein n=1 Tax=Rhizopus delemar (strain RA 99-880 / ATCC MYA-4621 / FGSC 9543 / NRRL 43880) TaxID=246409 RepID=I1BLH4_RHIO9|nr:hypothetical protein RO3G_01758 [Rhizopus delemar RA 99-880]|eukprot:EIE77054.1 hypothetical protein RO3G_01758 [Rhizopus delemar RA 99-880]
MCPLCNQSVKENQLYPVATLDVIIEEFIKMKQDYLIDELTHLSAAQEREKERHAAETEESDLSAPQIQKECKILKKGILYGCYVVNEQWLENSIKKGYPIPESRYEISGDKEMGRTGAPEKARKNKESKKPNLFKGLKLCVVDDNLQRHVEKCILVGGGIIEDNCKEIIVCSDEPELKRQELKEKFPEKTLILKNWVFDSICNFELLEKDDYYL